MSTASTPLPPPGMGIPGSPDLGPPDADDSTFDPLRLCIFTTVALLAWVFGPFTVLVFATLGVIGYARARRAGLTRSKCVLRDTRLVLGYLALVGLAATVGVVMIVQGWLA